MDKKEVWGLLRLAKLHCVLCLFQVFKMEEECMKKINGDIAGSP